MKDRPLGGPARAAGRARTRHCLLDGTTEAYVLSWATTEAGWQALVIYVQDDRAVQEWVPATRLVPVGTGTP